MTKRLYRLFGVLSILFLVTIRGDTSSRDIYALQVLYNTTNGMDWDWSTSTGMKWVFNISSDPCLDHWDGVFCANCVPQTSCNVTGLSLNNHNLTGIVPDAVCNMSGLTNISMETNYLWSTLPTCILDTSSLPHINYIAFADNILTGAVPIPTSTNSQLQYVDLSVNYFSVLPSALGLLRAVTYLDLNTNAFDAQPFPDFIANLTAISYLDLSSNGFMGSVPSTFWSAMSSLSMVRMSNNPLNGTLAESMCEIHTLTLVHMYNSQYTGTIPACLFSLPALWYLVLNSNLLSGPLPVGSPFPNASAPLRELTLQENSLSGTIPSAVGLFHSLVALSISNNLFSGTVPNSLADLVLLNLFATSDNMLTGRLPSGLVSCPTLHSLIVSKNILTGPLPSAYGRTLVDLFLEYNLYTGTIPSIIGHLSHLQQLNLAGNSLDGTLPVTFTALSKLILLSADTNAITGRMDVVFNNNASAQFPLMQMLSLSSNQFSGPIPSIILGLPSIGYVSLSENCFSGTFPSVPGSTTLQYVYMDVLNSAPACRLYDLSILYHILYAFGYNDPPNFRLKHRIEGGIPANVFSANPNLSTFQCSGNGIDSALPEEINSKLSVLKMPHNRLFSSIPASIQQSQILAFLDVADNRIGGVIEGMTSIYNVQREANKSNSLHISRNRITGHVPSRYRNVENISVLSGNGFQCNRAKTDIPVNDPDFANVTCGSDELDHSLYMIVVVTLLLLLLLLCTWLQQYFYNGVTVDDTVAAVVLQMGTLHEYLTDIFEFVLNKKPLVTRWLSTDTRPQAEKNADFAVVTLFLVTVGELRTYALSVALLCLVVFMPIYVLLKTINDQYFSTRQDQYGWVVSSLYLEGNIPSWLLLVMWLLVFAFTIVFGRHIRQKTLDVDSEDKEIYHQNQSDFSTYVWRICQFMTNVVVVGAANAGYTNALATITSTFQHYVAVALFTLFNFIWRYFVTDFLLLSGYDLFYFRAAEWCVGWVKSTCSGRPVTSRFEDYTEISHASRLRFVNTDSSCMLQIMMLVFNSVLIPCFIVSVTNIQCFSGLLSGPTQVDNSVSFYPCDLSGLGPHGDNYILDLACGIYTDPSLRTITTVYDLPFLYGHQCMSEILAAYVPVYLFTFFISAVVMPVMYLLLMYFYRIRVDSRMSAEVRAQEDKQQQGFNLFRWCRSKIFLGTLKFWPIEHAILLKKFSTSVNFSGSRSLLFYIIGSILEMLTFGIAFPPLALCIALSIVVTSSQYQYVVQTHLNCLFDLNMDGKKYCHKLEEDCKGMWKVFHRYVAVLLVVASCFNSLFLSDTSSRNNWIPLIGFVLPVSFLLSKTVWKWIHPKSYREVSNRLTKSVSRDFQRFSSVTGIELMVPVVGQDSWPVSPKQQQEPICQQFSSSFPLCTRANSVTEDPHYDTDAAANDSDNISAIAQVEIVSVSENPIVTAAAVTTTPPPLGDVDSQ